MVSKETKQLYFPVGGRLCLDFVNSVGRSVEGTGNESLLDFDALATWIQQSGRLPGGDVEELRTLAGRRPDAARVEWQRACAFRETLFRIFRAIQQGEDVVVSDLAELNAELAVALAHARLEPDAGGYGWSWVSVATDLRSPRWPIARSAANLLTSADRSRIKECASPTCLWLFVDGTRNHSRRWCEMKGCGNLAKVRRHRKRRREAGPKSRPG